MNLPLIKSVLIGVLATSGISIGFLLIYDPDELNWYGNADIYVKSADSATISSLSDSGKQEKKTQWCSFENKTFSNDDFECTVYSTNDTSIDANKRASIKTFSTKITNESSVKKGQYYRIHAHRKLWNIWSQDSSQRVFMTGDKKSAAKTLSFKPIVATTDTNKILQITDNSNDNNTFLVGKAVQIVDNGGSATKKTPKKPAKKSEISKGAGYQCSGYEVGTFVDCQIYNFSTNPSTSRGVFDNSVTTETTKVENNHYYKIVGDDIAYDPLFVKPKNDTDETKIINLKEVYNSVFTSGVLFIFDERTKT